MANEGSARRGLAGNGWAEAYDSEGIENFIRDVSSRWASTSDNERGLVRRLLHDTGHDVGAPQVMDDGGNLLDDPSHAAAAVQRSPRLDRHTLLAAKRYLDIEARRPGGNAERYAWANTPLPRNAETDALRRAIGIAAAEAGRPRAGIADFLLKETRRAGASQADAAGRLGIDPNTWRLEAILPGTYLNRAATQRGYVAAGRESAAITDEKGLMSMRRETVPAVVVASERNFRSSPPPTRPGVGATVGSGAASDIVRQRAGGETVGGKRAGARIDSDAAYDGKRTVGAGQPPASIGVDPEADHHDVPPDVLGSLLRGKGIPLGNGFAIDESMPRLPKPIVRRDAWSKVPPDESKLKRYTGPYTGIILHHTGSEMTPQGVEVVERAKEPLYKRRLRQWGEPFHLSQSYEKNGDVGYNFMIAPDGTIYEGRSLQYIGAHVLGHSTGNIGIAFLGDYSDQPLSVPALSAAAYLIADLRDRYHMGKGGANFITTHAQYNESKRNELRGAQQQIIDMELQLRKKP
ncbi:MAG: peptidoglycan recognition protein family protein [Solimonas sp.]